MSESLLVACSKVTRDWTEVSSTLRPAFTSDCRPRSIPSNPPKARKAFKDFGFRILLSWPGLNAKGLLSTLKSFSDPGSGRSAASASTVIKLDPHSDCAGVKNGFDIVETNDDPDGVVALLLSIVSALLRVRVSKASVGGARLLLFAIMSKGVLLLIVARIASKV